MPLLTSWTAAWFCAQCLARLGQRVGISILELNTLGHAVCALLIYCLWWRKPLDTKEPEQILIREEEELQLVAILCATSTLDEPNSELNRWEFPLLNYIRRLIIIPNSEVKPPKSNYDIFRSFSRMQPQFNNEHTLPRSTRGTIMKNWGDGAMFFPMVSSGPGTKRWIVGLGNATVSRKLSDNRSELLQSRGYRCTS